MLSWPLTVTKLSKTWVVENLDSFTARFICKWLELPISATLSGIILPQNKFEPLGFTISKDKSSMNPTHIIEHLGFILNSLEKIIA